MALPLAALLFAASMGGSYALGEGLHRGTKTRRLGEVERDIFDPNPDGIETDRKAAEAFFKSSFEPGSETAAKAVLAYRAGVKYKDDYAKAKENTWGDTPGAMLRVDKQDLLADIGVGLATGGLGSLVNMGRRAVAGAATNAAAPAATSLMKKIGGMGWRGAMEGLASAGGQIGGNSAAIMAEDMGLGGLGQTAASVVGGLAGGMGGSLGGHAASAGYRHLRKPGLGKAVADAVPTTSSTASSVPASAPELPAPTPGRIGRQTPIVYGQVGRQTPSRGFADLLARAQAADADALANPVIPSKRGSASASDFLSLMEDAPAGNTVSPAVAKATAEETRRSAFLKLRDLMQADVNGGAKTFNSADLRARVQKELGLPDNDPVLGQINSKSVSRTADIIRKNMESKAQIILNTADAAQDLSAPPATPPAPKGARPVTFAGIGSRKTPEPIQKLMTQLSEVLTGQRGWNLRSGGAEGADTAFEAGVSDATKKRIYLPTKKLKGRADGVDGAVFVDNPEAVAIAQRNHPAWDKLSDFAKKLITRNTYQVLGDSLDDPSDVVIAWAPIKNGKPSGGTSQAIRIAQEKGIPVVNLATRKRWTLKEVLDEIDRVREGGRPSKPKETGAFTVGEAPKSDRIPGTIDPAHTPKNPEDFEDEWRQGDPRGAAGTNVSVSDERADAQPPYNNIRTDHRATDPFDARAYTEDAPVQEANRLANQIGERERSAKGLKTPSVYQKKLSAAWRTIRGKVTAADAALHKAWMEKLSPSDTPGTDVPKSQLQGATPNYDHKRLNGLVSAKTYAAVRQLGENVDVDQVDLDYIDTIRRKMAAIRKSGADIRLADLENDLMNWMASQMNKMDPADIDRVAANYPLQRQIFDKIHLLMPSGSRALLTDQEQQRFLIETIGPKAAAIARSRATVRLAKEAAEEEQAYAIKIKEEIRKAKAKMAAEAGAVEQPDPRDAALYGPDTTPNGGGQDVDIDGKNRSTVDAELKNPPKPAFTLKDRMRVNMILDDILPLQKTKDVPFRRAVAEAADVMRQRSMKMLDIPEEIRPWAEKLNEVFDKPHSKKGNGQSPSGQAAGRDLTSDLDLAPEDDLLVNSGERRLSAQEIRELEDVTPPLGGEGFRRAETDAGLGVTFGGIPSPEIDPDSLAGKALHATKKWLWEPLSNLPVALQRTFRHWEDRQAVLRSDIYAVGRELRKYRNEAGFDNARLKELWTKGGDPVVDALRERYARVVTPVLKRAEEMGLLKKGSSDPFHMPRLYRVFEEHGFVPADELWEPAAASLVKSGVAKDADEAMEILGDLVNARNQGRDNAHKVAATLDRAMKQKDVPEELRLFLGEMDDPVYAMWKNAVDWSRDVETLTLAHNLVAQGKGDWVSDKPVPGWVKWDDRWLQAWASGTGLPISKTGSLSKMWVHPDVAEPLIRSHREASDLAKAWRVGMSLFKMAKVPLSMATQMVNVIGNSWLVSLGGMNIFKQGEALPGALEMVINSRRGVDSDWVKMAKEAGVIGKHFMAGDLDLLADGFKETMKIKKGSAPLKAMLALREMVDRSPLAKPGEWYGMLEDSYRLMLFKHYMTEGMDAPMFSRASAFLKKTMPSADEAAEEVNRVLFDYTRVPKVVDAMRNTAWPFITFPYKYATSVGRMVVKNPPRLFAHIMGAAFLVNELKKNGYDVNVSRFIPGMGVLFPEEYEREKSPAARVLDVLKPGGPAVLPYELAAGKSVFTGGDIYYDDDTTGERIKKGAVHTFRTLAPTLLGYTGKKLLQAWDDTFNNGQPENRARRDFTRELVEATTGVRVTPRTQEQWTNKQRTVYGRMRSEQARFSAWMRANPNAAEGEVADRQARLQKSLLKLWERWDELEEEKKGLPSR